MEVKKQSNVVDAFDGFYTDYPFEDWYKSR